MKIEYINRLPIPTININNPEEKARHGRMVRLVERMLDLHAKKNQAKADSEKELFGHQIKATDREVEGLVFRLYELTVDEIKMVEGTKR